MDMPLCSRRAWTTWKRPVDPSTLTTYPPPGCYDDGVVLPRFQSDIQTGRRRGDYHHDHPHTAADVALRVPVLSRQTPSYRPTFIPALTADHLAVPAAHVARTRTTQRTPGL